ncbi:MAG TPA: amidohydrolase [Bacillota bacterium]|nr:amidohydrolase [Bacillota bacterium]
MILKSFIDSHLHMLGIGYYQEIIDLKAAKSIDEILSLVKNNESSFVVARGFNQANLKEKRMPVKQDLHEVDKPLILFRICGHVAVVNQRMLDVMGIDEFTPQIEGGSFDYNSGTFTEKALGLVYDKIPEPTKEDLKRYLINANKILISNGITKVASDDFSSFNMPYELVIEAINEVDAMGLLDVEITEQVNLPIDELKDFIDKGYANKRFNNFKMGPLKILADGSLGGKTAALFEDYSDDSGNKGILTFTDQELYELVSLANKNGMDSVIHAIGDRTVDQVIRTFKKVQEELPRKSEGNAIIHAQLATKKQIKEMEENNIGAIVQPIFINSDIKIVDERIGDRKLDSYLFKTMFKNIKTGFSTDAPVENVNPFENIYVAISRKSIDFPDYESFLKEEAFKIEEALKAYTDENIRFVYDESHEDYIEIDRDIYQIPVEEIKDIKVIKVIKKGRTIYEI